MIRAEVHDDEFRTTARFDATLWFEQASDKDITDLAAIGWRGDKEADAIAEFLEGRGLGEPDTIEEVFKACSVLDTGFEVSIEPDDAVKWVADNRPQLMETIGDFLG